MTTLDDTRHCPMCEDSAKKILELEQRVKVLTDYIDKAIYADSQNERQAILEEALELSPQQTAAQIERWHVEWMMKLPVVTHLRMRGDKPDWAEDCVGDPSGILYGYDDDAYSALALVAIPPLPKEGDSPETDLDEALRRQ